MLEKLLSLKKAWPILIYACLDLICVGVGMGVPFFCILLGLPMGWYIVRRLIHETSETKAILEKLMKYAALTSLFTLIVMVAIWATSAAMLFDPTADLANYGIPMILYEPRPSFIGWIVLMMVISPFLQFLMTLFGGLLTWHRALARDR